MYSIVVLLLDGLGDRAHDVLGGRTSNEAAHTPNLDRLAGAGSCGLMYAVGPGRAPSSEVALWSMLGYRPDEFCGRAVLEAIGRGQVVSERDVFAYAALRTAEQRGDGLWLSERPRPGEDKEDAEALVGDCDHMEIDGLHFSLSHVWRGEAVLRVSGGADPRVTDSESFFRDRHPVLRPQPLVPEAQRTARAAEEWSRRVVDLLAHHPLNAAREGRRLPVLNVITLKWWGRPRAVPSFRQRHGVGGSAIAAAPFLCGLAQTIGLEAIALPETDDPVADLGERLARVEARLDAGDTFVLCHHKAADEAGHSKDPRVKQRTIELLDQALPRLPLERAVVCVTGDHATPPSPEVIHSGDPVPFVLAGPGVRADDVRCFGELDCARGILGHLRGPDMMPVLLNAADRPLFLGSRPTTVDGADGHPDTIEPLR